MPSLAAEAARFVQHPRDKSGDLIAGKIAENLMVKRILYFVIPGTAVMWALFLTASVSMATQDYTKKEKKSCTYCHTSMGKKDLNDVGKCYAEHNHSLEGCEPAK